MKSWLIYCLVIFFIILSWLWLTTTELTNHTVNLNDRLNSQANRFTAKIDSPEKHSPTNQEPLSPNSIEQEKDQNDFLECPQSNVKQESEVDFSAMLEELANSDDDQDTLTHIFFNKNNSPEKKLKQLSEFHQNDPNNQIVFYHLLNSCHVVDDKNICTDELFSKAHNVDPDNGMIWANIAALKLKRGDQEGALEELRAAANKTYFSEYYYRSLELFSSTISNYRPDVYAESVVAAIGYLAAMSINYGKLAEYCMSLDDHEIEFLDACFQLGKGMSKNSETLLLQSIGNALVTEYFSKNQNDDAVVESELEQSALLADNFNSEALDLFNWISNDADMLKLWLKIGREQGEAMAFKYMVKEAKWRSQDPNYNPCQSQVVQ